MIQNFIDYLKSKTLLDYCIFGLFVFLLFQISAKFYFRHTNSNTISSQTIETLKINKVCMDLPMGITECIEGNASLVYNIVAIPDPHNPDVSTLYLKVK